ncbi:MAG: nitroreductase family protein [Bacillota bacterium]|nr:nitroreductase family protein [Bacillota bacterium]
MPQEYPNDTIKVLFERASCRSFEDKPVESDVLTLVLDAGIHAASGGNLQPFSIIKVEDVAASSRLADLCGDQQFIAQAPVNLLFCIDFWRLKRWAQLEHAPFTATSSFRHFWISFQDTIIAAQNVCTAADAVGLGSVYVGSVLECFRELREMFALPEAVFPVVLLSLGYPKLQARPRRKLPVSVVVHDGKYRDIPDDDLLRVFAEKYPLSAPIEATPERLGTFRAACNAAGGPEFAARCLERVEQAGGFNMVQRYFGLHYCANRMPMDNTKFLEILGEVGFHCFEEYVLDRSDG